MKYILYDNFLRKKCNTLITAIPIELHVTKHSTPQPLILLTPGEGLKVFLIEMSNAIKKFWPKN